MDKKVSYTEAELAAVMRDLMSDGLTPRAIQDIVRWDQYDSRVGFRWAEQKKAGTSPANKSVSAASMI